MSRIKGNILRIKDFSFFVPVETKDVDNFKFNSGIILIAKNKNDYAPVFCVIEDKSEPEYDYDYEDNLVYMGDNTTICYHPIEFNPYDGTKMEFIVQEVINLTSQFEDIKQRIEETEKMRYSLKKNNLLSELSKELDDLLKDVPPCFSFNEENIYSSEDKEYTINLF